MEQRITKSYQAVTWCTPDSPSVFPRIVSWSSWWLTKNETSRSLHITAQIGIYAQSYVYLKIFMIIVDFQEKLGTESWFWSKSCFCSSRTAQSVPVSTDPRFEFAVVESTPSSLELKYFFDPMCASPFWLCNRRWANSSSTLLPQLYFEGPCSDVIWLDRTLQLCVLT